MTRSTVVANRLTYTVNGLEPRARGGIFQAVVAAQLVDGLTGTPVEGARVRTSFPGLRSRAAHSGFVGLVGDPGRALPGLRSTAYDVDVLVEAPGYAPRHEVAAFAAQPGVAVPFDPGFPTTFAPVDLGVLRMRRDPVDVLVGTYKLNASFRPVALAGATVRVAGSWARTDLLGSAALTTALLAVAPGLSARRPNGAGLDVPTLTPLAEDPRFLTAAAAAGETRIAVSHRGPLSAGDLVGLDPDDAGRAEYVEVAAVEAAADAGSPAVLVLEFPLRHEHREQAVVAGIQAPGAAPPGVHLVAEALAGDRTLAVNTLSGLAAGQVVRVSGGTAAPEYRTTDLYEVTTNSLGFGRFPPMTGVAAITVSAVFGGLGATGRVSLTQSFPAVDLTLK